jgi:hypothetical protein
MPLAIMPITLALPVTPLLELYGVVLAGASTTKSMSNMILNNTVQDFYAYGISWIITMVPRVRLMIWGNKSRSW